MSFRTPEKTRARALASIQMPNIIYACNVAAAVADANTPPGPLNLFIIGIGELIFTICPPERSAEPGPGRTGSDPGRTRDERAAIDSDYIVCVP